MTTMVKDWRMLTSHDVSVSVKRWQNTGEIVSENVARVIASYWQSPGYVGRYLAQFASTGKISHKALRDDILATIRECEIGADVSELHALLAFLAHK